jgi:hypothetical protein
MTNLAYKSGGLIVKSGGLATSCSCCGGPCTVCGGCDLTTYIELDERVLVGTDLMGYFRYSELQTAKSPPDGPAQGPWHITWKTGYPASLSCYFWWFSFVSCYSVTGSDAYAHTVYYYRLFQCEDGVAVNRTNEAITSASMDYDINTQWTVENFAWGYAIKQVVTGDPPEEFDDLNGECLTDVEDIEPLDPEFVC